MRTYARPNGATEQVQADNPVMSDAELNELVSRSLAELEQHQMIDAQLGELSQQLPTGSIRRRRPRRSTSVSKPC
jgi:hypothetical protein